MICQAASCCHLINSSKLQQPSKGRAYPESWSGSTYVDDHRGRIFMEIDNVTLFLCNVASWHCIKMKSGPSALEGVVRRLMLMSRLLWVINCIYIISSLTKVNMLHITLELVIKSCSTTTYFKPLIHYQTRGLLSWLFFMIFAVRFVITVIFL